MLISVIVPVYNVKDYLCRCLDSILNQSFKDFDLILIDDGSTDGSEKICDDYASKDERIYVIHQQNGGAASARNKGIEWSLDRNSEWLAFIDSDDWVHCDYLKNLLEASKKFNTDMSVCLSIPIKSPDEKPITNEDFDFFNIKPETFYVKLKEQSIVPWGKLIKKKLFKNVRFPNGKLYEDEFTLYKIIFAVKEIALVNKKMYYAFWCNSSSVTKKKWTEGHLSILDAYNETLLFFKENNYEDLYMWQRKRYLSVIAMQYKAMIETATDELKEIYEPILRKKLKKEIKLYRKECDKFPIKGNEWIYECSNPKKMVFYWHMNKYRNFLKKS